MKTKKVLWILLALLAISCSDENINEGKIQPLLKELKADDTGLHMSNTLRQTVDLNILDYMYFFNGGGVGVGDFNNDGLVDVYFGGNQVSDKIFLNEGDLKFKDISSETLKDLEQGWSTGISVIDINTDGLLDIYVSRVSNFKALTGHNQLLICTGIDDQGVPHYEEQSEKFGLAFSGFSTQSVFFDFDLDGDLDMFLLNHSIHKNGTFGKRSGFLNTYHPTSGDRLYRNDQERFVDVTKSSGINSSVIGYGLGLAVSDLNDDGYPDLYVGNDFHENDYLYINNQDGTFTESIDDYLMHTSRFSMGVDIADLNNDNLPEIMTLDMLPYDPVILKSSEGEDAVNTFNFKLGFGYNYQYAKNALQLNNGNGTFSEVGMYAGVHATDWSWSTLLLDLDNDGLKDIFVSNGIPKRMNDIDYINFMSGHEIQGKAEFDKLEEADLKVIDRIPEIKIPNRVFKNMGEMKFKSTVVENQSDTYSNGAAYADFDNDGDYDVVVNNTNDEVLLYENISAFDSSRQAISLKLKGSAINPAAIGSKVYYEGANGDFYQEYQTVKGFQSSMLSDMLLPNLGAGKLIVVWPDGKKSKIAMSGVGKEVVAKYYDASPTTIQRDTPSQIQVAETQIDGIVLAHKENPFNEFDREALIPHTVSAEGPAIAVGDLNGDGKDDLYFGAAKRDTSTLLLSTASGYQKVVPESFIADAVFEDTDAIILDVDNDGDSDIIVVSGGNEFASASPNNEPRLYINTNGQLSRKLDAFEGIRLTGQVITLTDLDGDGDQDAFIGARAAVRNYGRAPRSYFLKNDGHGKFTDVTESYCPDIRSVGLVTDAVFTDHDTDGDDDLLISTDWGPIFLFRREGSTFTKSILVERRGFWNTVYPTDVDADGDIDYLIGNVGENTRFKGSVDQPIKMYLNDFDNNKKVDQIITYWHEGKEILFATYMELQKQIPSIKKKALYATDFANMRYDEVLPKQKFKHAEVLEMNYNKHLLLRNTGNTTFQEEELPWQLQLAPIDCFQEISPGRYLIGGNTFGNNIQRGRYDASYGMVLHIEGNKLSIQQLDQPIRGDIKTIEPININGEQNFAVGINNDKLKIIKVND